MAFLRFLAVCCLGCAVLGLVAVFDSGLPRELRAAGLIECIFALTFSVMALAVAEIYDRLCPRNLPGPRESAEASSATGSYAPKRKLGPPIKE